MSGISGIAASAIILGLAFTISLTCLDYGLSLYREASSLILNIDKPTVEAAEGQLKILNVKFKVEKGSSRVLEVKVDVLNCGEKPVNGRELKTMDIVVGYLKSEDLRKAYVWIPPTEFASENQPYWEIVGVASKTVGDNGEALKPNLEALNPGVVDGFGKWDPGEILTIKISFPNSEDVPYYSEVSGGKFTLILTAPSGVKAELNFTDPDEVSYTG